MTDLTPAARAWLNADRLAADLELDGLLDADAIEQMDMATYARLRQRAGLAPYAPPAPAPDAPAEQVSSDAALRAQFPDNSPDFGAMTMDEYAQVRAQFINPTADRGLFN